MKQFSIDRFEEEFAVLIDEKKTIVTVSRRCLPQDAKEGDILLFDGKEYILDLKSTSAKKTEVKSLIDELFR